MAIKDYFSQHAKTYAAFRPTYPKALYDFIFSHVNDFTHAWDCGTGNGQVAGYLSKYFQKVSASDISQQQIDQAVKANNIEYTVCPGEKTLYNEKSFDLITVAQALHWINTEKFYNEVKRTSKPKAIIAVWGYALLNIQKEIDERFIDFYSNTFGPFWDPARKLIENEYRDIPFPFRKIVTPKFSIEVQWTLAQFAGYLTSWSATQKYIREKNQNPVPVFIDTIRKFWKEDELKKTTFPLFLNIGHVH